MKSVVVVDVVALRGRKSSNDGPEVDVLGIGDEVTALALSGRVS